MLNNRQINYGKLVGTIYDFENVGDELERHVHGPSDVHISIVARGSFLAFGDGWERELKTGAVADWEPGIYHGFRALEAKSRLVNIIKG